MCEAAPTLPLDFEPIAGGSGKTWPGLKASLVGSEGKRDMLCSSNREV